jgi:hypothetical protein
LRAWRRSALATFERVLGPDHPSTVTSRNNLAAAYMAAGRADRSWACCPDVRSAGF